MADVIETTDAEDSNLTSYTLDPGQFFTGTLTAGDGDWIAMTLVEGQTYTIAMSGMGASASTIANPFLSIVDEAGMELASSDDDGPGNFSVIKFTAPSDGVYYIRALAVDAADAGDYMVSLADGIKSSFDEEMGAAALLRAGLSWSGSPATGTTLTWAARDTMPTSASTDASGNVSPFAQLTAAQITAVTDALAAYSDVADLTFTQVDDGAGYSNDATLLMSAYSSTKDGAAGYAQMPGTTASGDTAGDVRLNNSGSSTSSLPTGSYEFLTIVHEIGHALGLSHPGDYNADPDITITYEFDALFTEDTRQYSVMSYFSGENTTNGLSLNPDGLLLYDILAIQKLYDVNATTRATDTVYGFNATDAGTIYDFTSNTDPLLSIWDGGGSDTIDVSGWSMTQVIDLREGKFSSVGGWGNNLSIAFGAVIENAIGGDGDDLIIGNAADNELTGNDGDDVLDGKAGADTMTGNDGDDTYYVDDAGDTVVEAASEGTDTVRFLGANGDSYTLGSDVENLILIGKANTDGNGNGDDNVITGNAGDNTLYGDAGTDTLSGGKGDDTYQIDDLLDTVVENADEGTDTVTFDGADGDSYALTANVENLTLINTTNTEGTGNGLDNIITGNDGDNVLDGGAGVDTLVGGLGDDTYVVDIADDIVTEAASEGTDLVQFDGLAGETYVLGANIENIAAIGTADTNITGNGDDNDLVGNAGANRLDGGAGDDTMDGGEGSDTYVVDAAGDVITDTGVGVGDIDTVEVHLTTGEYVLADELENLVLKGTSAIDGKGNVSDNVLTGNNAKNTLTGLDGDDTYIIQSGDIVVEAAGEGSADSVTFHGSNGETYVLADEVENLTLGGIFATNGTGNVLDNIITGNKAANIIDGGVGADEMHGEAGDDTYYADDVGDTVIEDAGKGIDTVVYNGLDATKFTLGANIENLTLSGFEATDGDGNADDNVLTGNAAANTLTGGAGDDTYVIDMSDTVVELASEGTDLIRLHGKDGDNYTLAAEVENLELLGNTKIDATGNALANNMTGNTADNVLDGGTGNDTLSGGFGDDTYIVDVITDVVIEGEDGGEDLVRFNGTTGAYVLSANVENLTLEGASAISGTGNALNNILTGNGAANTLTGLEGDDTLDGGAGDDTLVGGVGNDTYIADSTADVATEALDAGIDLVKFTATTGTYVLGVNVENLLLTGSGDSNGTGNALANTLTGNSGDNTLDGGAGLDTLIGGLGDDIYVADLLTDIIVENAGEGTDEVRFGATTGTYILGDNLENLTLTGTSNINGTGNALANTITGNSGNNILDGGLGKDTLIGGAGNDTYLVDNPMDVITEGVGAGTDSVTFTGAIGQVYTLSANIENLTLGGLAATKGVGNDLNNTITGNAADNVLNGGTGNDTLVGLAGNDTYIVDVTTDIVTEAIGAGTDIVQYGGAAGTTYTLSANVENLKLVGSRATNGTGNALANEITGNAGVNILDGGAGADKLAGLGGDDTYIVDVITDVVTELKDQGSDLVKFGGTTGTYILTANVENLELTGTAAINGTGNELVNNITGNSGKNILDGGLGDDTLTGGAGDDTYIADSLLDVLVEAASGGTDTVQYTGTTGTYVLLDEFENLTLLGSAAINGKGNSVVNTIIGNAADNILDGGAGADKLSGGAGNDTYKLDQTNETVTELIGAGNDTVIFTGTTGTLVLADNVEDLVLQSTSAVNGTGNALANKITGNSANNVLNGGLGNDILIGGGGDDSYTVDVATDTVIEEDVAGTDTVNFVGATGAYVLTLNVENLILGGTAAISGTGNTLANTITGNSANNTLDGKGGDDTLVGGLGDDTYIVDSVLDVITEVLNQGTDSAQFTGVAGTYVLGDNVERLTLMGTANTNGTGNALANTITGNTGNNILDGGAGVDTLVGGTGNDTYYVDTTTDIVTEATAAGTDTLIFTGTTGTRMLALNVENMVLGGSSNINGTGNTTNNIITGNAGDNILDGGAGNDTLIGGLGNDTYKTDVLTDIVTEAASEGTDTIIYGGTTGNFILSANVENLTLGGTSAISGTGNALDNIMTGNSAINTLLGGGGDDMIFGKLGNDLLTGGNGADTFVFDTALGLTNIDTIKDFNVVDDIFQLENAIFTTLTGVGGLASSQFRANISGLAVNAADRIIYETDTGNVYYDRDGSGAQASVLFAKVGVGLDLTANNFEIV